MIATILGLVGGVGGLVTAGAAALIAGWAGVRLGRWREAAATQAKIEAAEERMIRELQETGYAKAAEALRAGVRAGDDFDRRGVPDNDPHRRDR